MLIAERMSMSRQAMRKALLRLEELRFIELVRERPGVRLRCELTRDGETGLRLARACAAGLERELLPRAGSAAYESTAAWLEGLRARLTSREWEVALGWAFR